MDADVDNFVRAEQPMNAETGMYDCPFCGAPGRVETFPESDMNRWWFMPECSHCDCKLDNRWATEEEAKKDWNDRRRV